MSGDYDPAFIEGLKKVQALTVQVHTEVSRLIADLRPALLDTLGLIPAVRQHAESTLNHRGIAVSVQVRGRERRLSPEYETGLFRFIQGAVGNIAQHSNASNAFINFDYRDNELTISIKDNGQGFVVAEITDVEESGRGRGLFSMRERVGFLGGHSGVESEPGKGTTVWARVPIDE
jgi:signal transduction histidine kinase